VSSISARSQLDTVYGRHKAAAERLCNPSRDLVVRLGPMYGETLSKGVLIDMLQGKPVFAAGESRYCFAPLAFSAGWIAGNLDRTGTVEVGGRNAVSLSALAAHLGIDITFEGDVDHQEIASPEEGFPEASDVLSFLDSRRSRS
jgi:hypothetical protein